MPDILKPGRNCSGLYPVDRSGVLIDARDYFKAFYDAASRARSSILMSGWQFDSDVRLLRGDDARGAPDSRLLPFLSRLCHRNPSLTICMLAWDFSGFLAFEREWLQKWRFNAAKRNQIRFLFDGRHPFGACHHEKLIIIDGGLAFLGGMDLCAHRWDRRAHPGVCLERCEPRGRLYGPYHDVQAMIQGPAVEELTKSFQARWRRAGGAALAVDRGPRLKGALRDVVRMPASRVAIARTCPPVRGETPGGVHEIRALYIDAILRADRLIYFENQYFSSNAVYSALVRRMRMTSRPKLQIVVVLPSIMKSVTEDLAVGLAQVRILRRLRRAARETGHALGLYYTVSPLGSREAPRYIHSKVLAVDDRLLTVGSANAANRSLGLDTELNVAWEGSEGDPVNRAIRQLRVRLLREHTGLRSAWLESEQDLVGKLDRAAARGTSNLRRHGLATRFRFEWLQNEGDSKVRTAADGPGWLLRMRATLYRALASFA